jgi:hypothetical protein
MWLGPWFRSLFGDELRSKDVAPEVGRSSTDDRNQEAGSGSPTSGGRWCLIGNIVQERPCGERGREIKRGTEHFSPGTKVYCLPAQWGDGYERIIVIGRHRGSKRFVRMIIRSDWVTNWRAKVVYEPSVLRLIEEATSESWRRDWGSKEDVENYVASLSGGTSRRSAYVAHLAQKPVFFEGRRGAQRRDFDTTPLSSTGCEFPLHESPVFPVENSEFGPVSATSCATSVRRRPAIGILAWCKAGALRYHRDAGRATAGTPLHLCSRRPGWPHLVAREG